MKYLLKNDIPELIKRYATKEDANYYKPVPIPLDLAMEFADMYGPLEDEEDDTDLGYFAKRSDLECKQRERDESKIFV